MTADAVISAMRECDEIGEEEFLRRYGFGRARTYRVIFDGNDYPSKAILGVAHKFTDTGVAKTHDQFYGGKLDAAKKLTLLGFEVQPAITGITVDWIWDEHVLALDLYFRLKGGPPFSQESEDIRSLSILLRGFWGEIANHAGATFRNPNGVYMKLMNFKRLDPDQKKAGLAGLKNGSKGEIAVWNRFASDVEQLQAAAAAITSAMRMGVTPSLDDDEDDGGADYSVPEGSPLIRTHKARERSAILIKRKKEQVLSRTGRLACEVCEMTFGQTYGTHGEGFIEVHHTNPVALSEPGRRTTLDELACVCSNCHRMLHRSGLQSIEWLRRKLL